MTNKNKSSEQPTFATFPPVAEAPVPYPMMQEKFEVRYGQSFTDKEWRNETSVWAAAWKCATEYALSQAQTAQAVPLAKVVDSRDGTTVNWICSHNNMPKIGSTLYAAPPIVATVPSEPIQVYLIDTKKGYMIEGFVPYNTSLKLGFNTLYAVPPTQAIAGEAWQPIETAPADGSHIQLYAPELQFVGYYAVAGWCCIAPGCSLAPREPTHWKPLDAAPSQGAKQ
tara:strand:- start:424571 stop:425245 length:675 start_codon:yes stop_codon:yes gene_type:complete